MRSSTHTVDALRLAQPTSGPFVWPATCERARKRNREKECERERSAREERESARARARSRSAAGHSLLSVDNKQNEVRLAKKGRDEAVGMCMQGERERRRVNNHDIRARPRRRLPNSRHATRLQQVVLGQRRCLIAAFCEACHVVLMREALEVDARRRRGFSCCYRHGKCIVTTPLPSIWYSSRSSSGVSICTFVLVKQVISVSAAVCAYFGGGITLWGRGGGTTRCLGFAREL